jgi:pimeloyl-ACP methyl ester carboxylesterase
VIVLHGLLGSSRNWATSVRMLAPVTGRDFYLADLRNHGDSPHLESMSLADLGEDALHLGRSVTEARAHADTHLFSLLGHSLGGKAAMAAAQMQPEVVERLIVVDIAPVQHDLRTAEAGMVISALKRVSLLPSVPGGPLRTRAEIEAEVAVQVRSDMTRGFVMQNLEASPKEASGWKWRVNLDALERGLEDMSKPPTGPSPYKGPALFIFGGKSDIAPKSHHAAVHKVFPQAKVAIIPRAGHMPHFEARQELHSILLDFLNEKVE